MKRARGGRAILLAGCLALLGGCGVSGLNTAMAGKNANTKLPSFMATYEAFHKARTGKSVTAPATGGVYTYLHGVDDHARIVFVGTVQDKTQICTIRPEGTDFKVLTASETYKRRPVWSVDHKRIAFFQYPTDPSAGDKVDVMLMDENGGNLKLFLPGCKLDAKISRPAWKPDGTMLYLPSKDDPGALFGYEIATGRLADTVRLSPASFIKEIRALSPDMERIIGAGIEPKSGYLHIGAVGRAGGKDTDFMQFFQQKATLHLGAVAWSYDSSLVAFEADVAVVLMSSSYASLSKFKIYTLAPLEMNCEYTSPAFSPQGQYVTCVVEKAKEGSVGSGDQEIKSDLWVMNLDGSKPRQLTTSGSNFDPSW